MLLNIETDNEKLLNSIHKVDIDLKVNEKIIIESLSRMGIGDKKNKILYPSCYIFLLNRQFQILHFKELFILTKKNYYNNFNEEDINRKNAVIWNLQNWRLIDVKDIKEINPHWKFVFTLPYKEKEKWTINHKINLFKIFNNN